MTVPNPQPTHEVAFFDRMPVGGTQNRRPSTPDRETENQPTIRSMILDRFHELSTSDPDITAAHLMLDAGEEVAAAREAERDTEIQRLREYAETTRYHQEKHAKAVRDLEKIMVQMAERERTITELREKVPDAQQ